MVGKMFFQRGRKVEFVGGPFDGHRQTVDASGDSEREVIAVPVNENVFRMLAGRPTLSRARPTSVAVYELRRQRGKYRYHFMGSETPSAFEVESRV